MGKARPSKLPNYEIFCVIFNTFLAQAAQVTTNSDFDYILNNFWPRLPKLPKCRERGPSKMVHTSKF